MTTLLEMLGIEEQPLKPLKLGPLAHGSAREQFVELLRRRDALPLPQVREAQERLEVELLALHRKRSPPRKGAAARPGWEKILALCAPFAEDRDAIIARHRTAYTEACDHRDTTRRTIISELCRLAPQIEVLPGSSWTKVCEIADSAYSSQTQARWYAHGRAELRALPFLHGGFEVLVREVSTYKKLHDKELLGWVTYEVWAGVDETDLRVLEHRGQGTLAEDVWLQACLDRTLNPRVYRPTLDWDAERRLGVRAPRFVNLGETVPVQRVRWTTPWPPGDTQ